MRTKFKKLTTYILVLAVIFLPGTIKYYSLYRQKRLNEAKLRALMEENRRLAEENKKLREDPVYIEKMARDNLGLAKPGEYVAKFMDKGSKQK